jgi:hypothetical protein
MSDVAFWGPGDDPALSGFREALRTEWLRRGYEFVEGTDPSAACVFNFVNPDDPKPFRRRQRSTYVIAVHTVPDVPADLLRHEYPMLVRALANLAMLVVPGGEERSEDEYRVLLEKSGSRLTRVIPTRTPSGSILEAIPV